ncbi:capsule assembly Wzi family protein [Jejudonia soesokkakensis]|uniref:Capsule assembly Wzi family protein n=1 Tax=Jejudonia soesokkakensis TaxID=1323432 RepID=A0ABW2MU31_9FLAO
MKKIFLALCLCTFFLTFSQNVSVEGSVEATGIFSSEATDSPFWLYTNTNAAITPQTVFSGTAQASATYTITEKSFFEGGIAAFYREGENNLDNFQRRDLYLQFQNSWLKTTLGAKKQQENFKGLSATNKNILWSGNARPLPGLLLEANTPLKISETFGVDWGIGHYQLNDARYVNDVRVHYKRLGIVAKINERNTFTARVQHFAQWAGTSPDFGALPSNFNAFVDVFFAKKSSDDNIAGEVQNALGNHLGSYFLEYNFGTSFGTFTLYHEHPFEDGSGTRLANFPDGVWGVHLKLEKEGILSHLLYEYIDTSDQSGNSSTSGFDGYFGNNIYRSGWSYEDRVIGVPFILVDPSIELDMDSSRYVSNRAKVHHFGFTGTFKKVEWSLKSTVATFLGTYRNPFDPKLTSWSNYASVAYTTTTFGKIKVFAGADMISERKRILGGGVTYNYTF